MVLGGSVRVQRHRHRHSGNLKVTNGPTNQLTVVGSGDAYTSKKNLEMLKYCVLRKYLTSMHLTNDVVYVLKY